MKTSIRDRIHSAFNVINGLMVVVALTGVVALLAVIHQGNQAVGVGARLNVIGLEIQASNLKAGEFEKDFLLNIKGKGVEKSRQEYAAKVTPEVARIDTLCAEGMRIARTGEDRARFQEIRKLAQVYSKAFEGLVAAKEKRGFVDTGAEGDFRNAVHAIEAKIGHSDKAEIAMLTLRRSEKDYIMRGLPELIPLTHDNVEKLRTALQAAPLSPAEKTAALKSADLYDKNFSVLVAADREVDSGVAAYEGAGGALEAASAEVAKAGYKASEASLAASSTTAWIAILMEGLLSVGSVGAGIRYGSRISTDIIHPVKTLTDVAERASLGDLSLHVAHTCDDEIGDLQDSLARLVTAVRFYRTENEELTEEMKGAKS